MAKYSIRAELSSKNEDSPANNYEVVLVVEVSGATDFDDALNTFKLVVGELCDDVNMVVSSVYKRS